MILQMEGRSGWKEILVVRGLRQRKKGGFFLRPFAPTAAYSSCIPLLVGSIRREFDLGSCNLNAGQNVVQSNLEKGVLMHYSERCGNLSS